MTERVPSEDIFWHWLREGWKYRWARSEFMRANKQQHADQVQYESKILITKEFVEYFLMLSEAVRWAKVNGIAVGPARGSAAASLVCYLLRITEVNPLMFPTMLFERFIDLQRMDLPDVDLDFADDRRHEVRQHMVDKYGANRIGNIGNFTRYRGKNAIDDVARVYSIPKWKAQTVKDLVIERSGGDSRFDASLGDTRDMFPVAAEVFDEYPNLEAAIRLEGNYKGMGVHAAGLVVSATPINDTCAVYSREVKGHRIDVIAYDKKDAEYLGMLKADFLGLSTMGMISNAMGEIGMSLDELYQLPLDDPATIDVFHRADVIGIFQFEGRATRLLTMDIKPDKFMDVVDINALSRPGPLFSGAAGAYIDVRQGRIEAEHLHPIVDKYTYHSQYQIIYQEQVLAILREMGGFSASLTGALRKIISLKLGESAFNEWYDNFINGAKENHGIEAELADKVWRLLVTSGVYSLNIAHSVSYSIIAYWCAWLKAHHPLAFYKASLYKADKDKWPALIKDAERHGIKILPPKPDSGSTWEIRGNEIRAGMMQIPGVGATRAEAIANAHISTWDDISRLKGVGPKTVTKIEKWVNSEDPFNLYYAQRVLGDLREAIKRRRLKMSLMPNYTSDEIPMDADNLNVTWMGIPSFREYKDYIEDERARSGKEVELIMKEMKSPDLVKSCVVKCYDDGDEEVYLRFNRFKFPKFKDILEGVKLDGSQVLVARGIKRRGFGINVQVNAMIVLDVDEEDEEPES